MTAARLTVDTNEANGILYWVVTQSATAPTAFQIEGGVDENSDDADLAGSQVVSQTGTQTIDTEESPGLTAASGSPAEPMYYAHFMHKDAAGNRSAVVSSAVFTVGQAFATFADMVASPNITLSDDDLGVAPTATGIGAAFCQAFKSSGKHYFEVTRTDGGVNGEGCGIAPEGARNTHVCQSTGPWNCAMINGTGSFYVRGNVQTGSALGTVSVGNVLCFAVDLDNWLLWARNTASGDWNNSASADPETGVGGQDISGWRATRVAPFAQFFNGSFGAVAKWTFNLGASAFSGAVPSGFAAGWTSNAEAAVGHGAFAKLTTEMQGTGHVELGGLLLHRSSGALEAARVPLSDFKSSGKFYVEFALIVGTSNGDCVGVITDDATATNFVSNGTNCAAMYRTGAIWSNGGNTGKTLSQRADGDKIGMAVDLDNEKVWFRVLPSGNWNGEVIGSQDPENNVGGASISNFSAKTMGPAIGMSTFAGSQHKANFGNSAFVGAVPAGFTSGWPSAGASLPEVTYWGFYESLSATVDIGAPAADRLVIVDVCHHRSTTNSRSVSSFDIGGGAATVHAEIGNNASSGSGGAIASRVVAAGTQAAIAITLDGAVNGAGFHIYTATGYSSATPVDSDAQHANTATATLDVQNGGFVVGAAVSANVPTQTGIAMQDPGVAMISGGVGSARMVDTPTQTGKTYAVSGLAPDEVAVAVSWR